MIINTQIHSSVVYLVHSSVVYLVHSSVVYLVHSGIVYLITVAHITRYEFQAGFYSTFIVPSFSSFRCYAS